jgi:O-antigen/teichoic acid export membrane protein
LRQTVDAPQTGNVFAMQAETVETSNVLTTVEVLDRPATHSRARSNVGRRSDTVKALMSIIDQGIYSGTSFVTAVIVGRATSPDTLGMYYLTMTIVYVAIGLQECMISNPFAILSPRRHGRDLAEFASSTWTYYLSWSGICLLGILAALGYSTFAGDAHLTSGLQALTFALPLLLLRECLRRFAFARLRLPTAVAIDATSSTVQIAGLGLLAYFHQLTLFGIFAVMAAGCAVASLGWIASNWQSRPPRPTRALEDLRHTWPIARWSLASFMLTNTIPFIMPWIVDSAAGAAAAGLFGASATLVGVTNVLVLGGSNFLMPRAAEAFATRGAHGLSRVLLVMAISFIAAIGTFGAIILITGDRIPVFVYGAEFQGTGLLVATLAVNVLAGSLGMIAAQGLLVIGRQKNNFVIDICMFTITMVAAAILVPRYGALGAAQASVMGVTVGTLARALKLTGILRGMPAQPAGA